MSAADLHDLADTIKQVAVASLNLIPADSSDTADLRGAPERALVTPGLPVDDCCEQLAVHVGPVVKVSRSRGKSWVGWINRVTFTVTSGRCLPGSNFEGFEYRPPTAENLEESARQLNADGWALWNGLNNAHRSGLILGTCERVEFGPLTPRNPSGGCGGWTIVIEADLGGYLPDVELES